jgi:hypothetical protein
MPYCDIISYSSNCNPHHCHAAGGRCLPDARERCQQGIRESESRPRHMGWRFWEGTKNTCDGCSCMSANPAVIQSQQEMEEFVAHMKQIDDLDGTARKQKIINGAAHCTMGGPNCDARQCIEDGICCLPRADGRCGPHFVRNARSTYWTKSNIPESCAECLCFRKREPSGSLKPYAVNLANNETDLNEVQLVTEPVLTLLAFIWRLTNHRSMTNGRTNPIKGRARRFILRGVYIRVWL